MLRHSCLPFFTDQSCELSPGRLPFFVCLFVLGLSSFGKICGGFFGRGGVWVYFILLISHSSWEKTWNAAAEGCMCQLWIPPCHLEWGGVSAAVLQTWASLLCCVVPLFCPMSPPGSAPSWFLPWAPPAPAQALNSAQHLLLPLPKPESTVRTREVGGGVSPGFGDHLGIIIFQEICFKCGPSSSGSRGCRLPGALGRSWCLSGGTRGLCCGLRTKPINPDH